MKKYLFIILFLALLMPYVNALPSTTTIKHYLALENNLLYDNVIDSYWIRTAAWNETTGKIGQAVYSSATNVMYKLSSINYGSTNWTINFWMKANNTAWYYNYIELGGGGVNPCWPDCHVMYFFYNDTNLFNIIPGNVLAGVGGGGETCNKVDAARMDYDNISIDWNFFTWIYDGSRDYWYINNTLFLNCTPFDIGNTEYVYVSGNNIFYDEISIYEGELNASSITTLYNNGIGITYDNSTAPTAYFSINSSYFSYNQCIYDGHTAYLCNETIYDAPSNQFLCQIPYTGLINCSYGCITSIVDLNTSEIAYNTKGKSCSETSTTYDYIDFDCTTFTNFLLSYILTLTNISFDNNIYNIKSCISFPTYQIPSASCTSQDSLDIVYNNPGDIFFTQGQCLAKNCSDSCTTEGLYSCFNDYWQQKCIINPQTGCLFNNLTQQCAPGDVCRSGSCINSVIVNNNFTNIPPGTQTQDNINLWHGIFGDMANDSQGQLLIAIIMIVVSVLISGGFIIIVKVSSGMDVPSILATIIFIAITGITTGYFIVIGFIPFWILLILVIIIAFAIGAWIRNKAVGQGG